MLIQKPCLKYEIKAGLDGLSLQTYALNGIIFRSRIRDLNGSLHKNLIRETENARNFWAMKAIRPKKTTSAFGSGDIKSEWEREWFETRMQKKLANRL